MMLNLTRCREARNAGHGQQIIGLLKTIGVPNWMLYVRALRQHGSFWARQINHLEILEQARGLYRQRIVCVHPDKPGGSLEQTIQLNDMWGKIERLFKQHGHQLW